MLQSKPAGGTMSTSPPSQPPQRDVARCQKAVLMLSGRLVLGGLCSPHTHILLNGLQGDN